MPKTNKTMMERIKAKIILDKDCWLWTGAVDHSGIPKIAMIRTIGEKQNTRNVPRYLWRKIKGKEPVKIFNRCGMKNCVNPDHYAEAKQSSFRKISPEQCLEMRELWRLSELHKTTLDKLGKRFGITKQMVHLIVTDKSHLKDGMIIEERNAILSRNSIQEEQL